MTESQAREITESAEHRAWAVKAVEGGATVGEACEASGACPAVVTAALKHRKEVAKWKEKREAVLEELGHQWIRVMTAKAAECDMLLRPYLEARAHPKEVVEMAAWFDETPCPEPPKKALAAATTEANLLIEWDVDYCSLYDIITSYGISHDFADKMMLRRFSGYSLNGNSAIKSLPLSVLTERAIPYMTRA